MPARSMRARVVYCLLAVALLGTSTALASRDDYSISDVTLLLPHSIVGGSAGLRSIVYFPLEAYGGCFQWAAGNRDVIEIEPDESSACSFGGQSGYRRIMVHAVPVEGKLSRRSSWVWADDLRSEYRVECEVFVDTVRTLKILTSTRHLNVGDMESLEVIGFDDQDNTFTSLEGLPFQWTNNAEHILRRLSFLEAGMNTTDVRAMLESRGVSSDELPVQGLHPGKAVFTAELLDPRHPVKTVAAFSVTEPLFLCPLSTTVMVGGSVDMVLETRYRDHRHPAVDGDKVVSVTGDDEYTNSGASSRHRRILSMPSTQYQWASSNQSVVTMDAALGVGRGVAEGVVQVRVQDVLVTDHFKTAEVRVSQPARLTLNLLTVEEFEEYVRFTRPPFSCVPHRTPPPRPTCNPEDDEDEDAPGLWYITHGSEHVLMVRLFDAAGREIYVSDDLRFEVTLEGRGSVDIKPVGVNSEHDASLAMQPDGTRVRTSASDRWVAVLASPDQSGTTSLRVTLEWGGGVLEAIGGFHVSAPVQILADGLVLPYLGEAAAGNPVDHANGTETEGAEDLGLFVFARGGSNRYQWQSTDEDTVLPTTESKQVRLSSGELVHGVWVSARSPGATILQAVDRCNPNSGDRILAEVVPPAPLTFLPSPLEVETGSDDLRLVVGVTDVLGRPYDSCAGLDVGVSVSRGLSVAVTVADKLASDQQSSVWERQNGTSASRCYVRCPVDPRFSCWYIKTRGIVPGFSDVSAHLALSQGSVEEAGGSVPAGQQYAMTHRWLSPTGGCAKFRRDLNSLAATVPTALTSLYAREGPAGLPKAVRPLYLEHPPLPFSCYIPDVCHYANVLPSAMNSYPFRPSTVQTVSCFPPLTIQPGELLVAVASSSQLTVSGGPLPWPVAGWRGDAEWATTGLCLRWRRLIREGRVARDRELLLHPLRSAIFALVDKRGGDLLSDSIEECLSERVGAAVLRVASRFLELHPVEYAPLNLNLGVPAETAVALQEVEAAADGAATSHALRALRYSPASHWERVVTLAGFHAARKRSDSLGVLFRDCGNATLLQKKVYAGREDLKRVAGDESLWARMNDQERASFGVVVLEYRGAQRRPLQRGNVTAMSVLASVAASSKSVAVAARASSSGSTALEPRMPYAEYASDFLVTCLEHSTSPLHAYLQAENRAEWSLPYPVHRREKVSVHCVPRLRLSPRVIILGIGEQIAVNVTQGPTDGRQVSFFMEDRDGNLGPASDIASVSQDGVVTGLSLGETLLHGRIHHESLLTSQWPANGLHDVVLVIVQFRGVDVHLTSDKVLVGQEVVSSIFGKNGELPGDPSWAYVDTLWCPEEGGASSLFLLPIMSHPSSAIAPQISGGGDTLVITQCADSAEDYASAFDSGDQPACHSGCVHGVSARLWGAREGPYQVKALVRVRKPARPIQVDRWLEVEGFTANNTDWIEAHEREIFGGTYAGSWREVIALNGPSIQSFTVRTPLVVVSPLTVLTPSLLVLPYGARSQVVTNYDELYQNDRGAGNPSSSKSQTSGRGGWGAGGSLSYQWSPVVVPAADGQPTHDVHDLLTVSDSGLLQVQTAFSPHPEQQADEQQVSLNSQSTAKHDGFLVVTLRDGGEGVDAAGARTQTAAVKVALRPPHSLSLRPAEPVQGPICVGDNVTVQVYLSDDLGRVFSSLKGFDVQSLLSEGGADGAVRLVVEVDRPDVVGLSRSVLSVKAAGGDGAVLPGLEPVGFPLRFNTMSREFAVYTDAHSQSSAGMLSSFTLTAVGVGSAGRRGNGTAGEGSPARQQRSEYGTPVVLKVSVASSPEGGNDEDTGAAADRQSLLPAAYIQFHVMPADRCQPASMARVTVRFPAENRALVREQQADGDSDQPETSAAVSFSHAEWAAHGDLAVLPPYSAGRAAWLDKVVRDLSAVLHVHTSQVRVLSVDPSTRLLSFDILPAHFASHVLPDSQWHLAARFQAQRKLIGRAFADLHAQDQADEEAVDFTPLSLAHRFHAQLNDANSRLCRTQVLRFLLLLGDDALVKVQSITSPPRSLWRLETKGSTASVWLDENFVQNAGGKPVDAGSSAAGGVEGAAVSGGAVGSALSSVSDLAQVYGFRSSEELLVQLSSLGVSKMPHVLRALVDRYHGTLAQGVVASDAISTTDRLLQEVLLRLQSGANGGVPVDGGVQGGQAGGYMASEKERGSWGAYNVESKILESQAFWKRVQRDLGISGDAAPAVAVDSAPVVRAVADRLPQKQDVRIETRSSSIYSPASQGWLSDLMWWFGLDVFMADSTTYVTSRAPGADGAVVVTTTTSPRQVSVWSWLYALARFVVASVITFTLLLLGGLVLHSQLSSDSDSVRLGGTTANHGFAEGPRSPPGFLNRFGSTITTSAGMQVEGDGYIADYSDYSDDGEGDW